MAKYVYVKVLRTEFNINHGKMQPGDVYEMTLDEAVKYRRAGVTKPASKQEVEEYKKTLEDAPVDMELEDEDYVESDRAEPVSDAALAAEYEKGNESDDEDEDDEDEDEEDEELDEKKAR